MSESKKVDPSLLPGAISPDEKQFIFDRLMGYFDIKVLDVAIAHHVFDRIGDGAATVEQVAERCSLPARSVEVMLISLDSMGLIQHRDGNYSLTQLGKKFFVEDSPYYQGGYVRYCSWAADALPQLPAGLKENKPVWEGFSHYLKDTNLETTRAKQAIMNEGMFASNLWVSQTVLKHVDLSKSRHMLDLGGGQARFSAAAVSHYPNLKSTIMDLPQVCEVATKRIAAWGLSDKISTTPGDFIETDWPMGHDVITFIRAINARPRELIEALLKRAHDRLPKGGRIIVASAGLMVDRQGAKPGALGARILMLHTMAGRGGFQFMDEWPALLDRAGFTTDTMVVDDPYGMVAGTRKD